MSLSALELRVARAFQDVLNVDTLGVEDDFFVAGGTTNLAADLVQRLQPLTSKHLIPATLATAPSIASMTRLIRGDFRPHCGDTVACIQEGSDLRPIVLSHAIGGTVLFYHELASHLGTNRPIYALQAQGINVGETPLREIPAMAAKYRAALSSTLGHQRYQVGGYSFGCLIALEMARQAEEEGVDMEELVLIAPPNPPLVPTPISEQAANGEALALLEAFREREDVELSRAVELQLLELYKANLVAQASYTPRKVRADLLLVGAEMDPELDTTCATWQQLTSGAFRSVLAPGHHTSMIRIPNVNQWAPTLLAQL